MSDNTTAELRTAATKLRNGYEDASAADAELGERIADLLDEHARQYDLPPCSDPTGVCNRCDWDPSILAALAVARVINGGEQP